MLKYATNLIDGIVGFVADIASIVFVIAVILSCLRWLLGIGA